MVILADRQYTLDDLNKIIFSKIKFILAPDIQKKIHFLALKVGAPTYSRTPNFKKN